MKFIWRWLKRLVVLLSIPIVILLSPVGYSEIACRGTFTVDRYEPVLNDPEWQRAESRTLTTYPEWHIVHAYDDYAQVMASGDPHDFAFLRAIKGFWTLLCPLKTRADDMGGMTGDQKMTIYTIGVSFTVELLAKAAYEETLGRVSTWIRGTARTALDEFSGRQAADYARFLQQMPWYKWDFQSDIEALENTGGENFRDRERRFALGNEFKAKAWYAKVIEQAVADMGADNLRIRSIVTGLSEDDLARISGVTVVESRPEGIVIETDRYRAFTVVLESLADAGANIVEIAGNDQVLFTAISDKPTVANALHSFRRQGYDDWRHLILVPVVDLAAWLRAPDGLRLEHVHDY